MTDSASDPRALKPSRRYFFHLPHLTVARPFELGPLRLLPSGELNAELADALRRKPLESKPHRQLGELVNGIASEWQSSATLAVAAPDYETAAPLLEAGLAIFRLFLRPFISVNADIHKVGLADEVPLALRQAVTIDEDGSIGLNGRRIDGPVDFHIADNTLDAWDRDPRLAFLGSALEQPEEGRGHLVRKALTAIQMADAAFLSRSSIQKLLLATIALETLLSHQDPAGEYKSQTFDVARRVAYLTCPADHPESGDRCLYLTNWTSGKQLATAIKQEALAGRPWLCDPFMKIAAPRDARVITVSRVADGTEKEAPNPTLFDRRNEAAHEGRTSASADEVKRIRYRVDEVILSALTWMASHPGDTLDELDREIFAGPGATS